MKRLLFANSLLYTILILFTSSFCIGQDTLFVSKDGTYTGKSRASYTSEPYWGIVSFKVENGSFKEINFTVRDSSLHETFNEKYEKHFQGNPVYIQQSRSDWRGVQIYPKKLSEIQNIDKLDAISGATWSYNIFRASVKEALKEGTKQVTR